MKTYSLFAAAIAAALPLVCSSTVLGAVKKPGSSTSWSGAVAISPALQPDPTRGSQLNDVAVNASGLAVAAWDQFTYNNGGSATIGAAVQTGGKWGTPFTISGPSGFSMSPKVAVGMDGSMAVSWINQDPAVSASPQQRVQVAVRPAGSATWSTSTLAQGPIGGVAVTVVIPLAIDASGTVTAAWSLWDGSRHMVQSANKPKNGPWSEPADLAPSLDGLYLSLAINGSGDAGVAFTISPYSSYWSGTSAQYVFRRGPNGAWTAPAGVSETLSSSEGYITTPMVALDSGGLATVAYFGRGVEAVRELDPGQWTAPAIVLPPPTSVSSYQSIDMGADNSGTAVVAASIFDATINVDRASVWVALGAPDGTWSSAQRLTDPAGPVDAYATQVAVSPDGTLALVGWIDHYHGTVQVSQLNAGIWGPATTIGRGTAFSSFQELLRLDAAGSSVARAIWKNSKTGIQTMASSYGR